MGTVYLLHFSQPFSHARHYLGYSGKGNLNKRLEAHEAGSGSRLTQVIKEAGITFTLARTWKNKTRIFERQLKNRKNAPKLCPICKENNGRRG